LSFHFFTRFCSLLTFSLLFVIQITVSRNPPFIVCNRIKPINLTVFFLRAFPVLPCLSGFYPPLSQKSRTARLETPGQCGIFVPTVASVTSS
jgi:hypothetical protein